MITRRTLLVARWEFLRFAKAKSQIISVVVMVVLFAAFDQGATFVQGRASQERKVAVLSAGMLGLEEPLQLDGFLLVPGEQSPAVVDSLVLAGEFDAAVEHLDGAWQLRVKHDRGWQNLLGVQIGALAKERELLDLDLDPEVLAAMGTPTDVTTVLIGAGQDGQKRRAGTLVVIIVIGAMLLGILYGFGYVFTAITAEKTQRTTESLLSVLSPQQWIDGKILGLTGVILVDLLGILAAWFMWQAVSWRFFGSSLSLPSGLGGPELVLSMLFAAVGFAFWFTVFALVAATIDDPASSSRSQLMLLPFLPLGVVFAGLDSPDALWMRVLSFLPGASPSAMPVRILRGDPAIWEIALSLLLLAAGVMALRWAAGRVFGLSMLMTGKEPGLREVWRWLR
jgi:ABC-2 type transport system permease protein